jgi:hypothetical protein
MWPCLQVQVSIVSDAPKKSKIGINHAYPQK